MKSALMIAASMLAMMIGQAKADVEFVVLAPQSGELSNSETESTGLETMLPAFNTALGTLESFSLLISGSFEGDRFVSPFFGSCSGSVTVTPTIGVSIGPQGIAAFKRLFVRIYRGRGEERYYQFASYLKPLKRSSVL